MLGYRTVRGMGLIHYAFAEVKSYLSYELFDYNLMCGLLRKRVMANGGGMGVGIEGLDGGLLEVCNEASQGFVGAGRSRLQSRGVCGRCPVQRLADGHRRGWARPAPAAASTAIS